MKLQSVQSCLFKNLTFLVGLGVLAFYIRDILISIFLYNIQINSLILFIILFGITLIFSRMLLLDREFSKLSSFNSLKTPEIAKLRLISPVFLYLNKNTKILSQNNFQNILVGVEKRTEDNLALPKYLSGILIFLGLLGTFWGLSHTIGNVASIIDTLGAGNGDAAASFIQLKNSLKTPLAGMGIAFGCSLFGLSGSLVLGFLIVNLRKTSEDFTNKVETWLITNTVNIRETAEAEGYHGDVFASALMEKTIETIYAFQAQINQLENEKISAVEIQAKVAQELTKLTGNLATQQDLLKKMIQDQTEINKKRSEEFLAKLESIDHSLKLLYQESASGRKAIIQTLGNDIRTVSKVLSSLIRE